VALRKDAKFQALVGRLGANGAWLMLPQSFMNASGRPVQMLASFFKIPAAEILVVHDEVDFAPGVARLKQGGGIAGHNGLKDISHRLATHDYWRLRLGVGHPGDKDAVADYVLGRPAAEDRKAIEEAIERALEVMPQIIAGEVQAAMQKLHTDPRPAAQPEAKPSPEAAKQPEPAPAAPEKPAPAPEAARSPEPVQAAQKAARQAQPAPAPSKEGEPQAEARTTGKLKGLLGSLLHPKRRK
jgi:PTH1 family peptidyl-tRNA hydrolase